MIVAPSPDVTISDAAKSHKPNSHAVPPVWSLSRLSIPFRSALFRVASSRWANAMWCRACFSPWCVAGGSVAGACGTMGRGTMGSGRSARNARVAVGPVAMLVATLVARAPIVLGGPEPSAPADYLADVRLDTQAHTLSGLLRVRVPESDGRPLDIWYFHLPPNRFLEPDPRGPRRLTDSIPFGFSYLRRVREDPLFPEGFSAGGIRIVSVEDEAGRQLSHGTEDNPLLAEGFAAQKGLLRVEFAPASSGREVNIRFETRLPQRHWDGWNEAGIFVERWHPMLLTYRDGRWERHPDVPAPARYTVNLTPSDGGRLIAGGAAPRLVSKDISAAYSTGGELSRVFPLLFFPDMEVIRTEVTGVSLYSYYREGESRTAQLLLNAAARFLEYAAERFGLRMPRRSLSFVPTRMLPGDLRVTAGAVLVPDADYHNSSFLDRVVVGRVARAVAQQWFGESVWEAGNLEGWLTFGVSGYLALDFFTHLYGWDGPIHTVTDWLAPRYREHYFEAPARSVMRQEFDAPVLVDMKRHRRNRPARVSIHHKSPLVIRQLAFVVGDANFRQGLRHFAQEFRNRAAGSEDFRRIMEQAGGEALDWYFAGWFRGITRLDYALGDWSEDREGDGYAVAVPVERIQGGRMPVEVMVLDEDGRKYTRRWEGTESETRIVIHTRAPAATVVIDPHEKLLEIDRKNNYDDTIFRVRPFFDWAKDREVLVALRGTAGGNAIDGNYVFLGVSVNLNADNEIFVLPGYGQKSEELLYSVRYTRRRLGHPRLSFSLRQSRIGGRTFQGMGISFNHDLPERMALSSALEFRVERLDRRSRLTADGPLQDAVQDANNLNWRENFFVQPHGHTDHGFNMELERSAPEFGSDFEYTTLALRFPNGFDVSHNHRIEALLIRSFTEGASPVQKKHLLGDPLVLRGYPRSLRLVSDQILALRVDYRFVFNRSVFGREIQSRKMTAIFFADVGRGWNNSQNPNDTPVRQDVGVGIEIDTNLINQVDFPIRIEIARPVNDPEYKDTQYIFFQALAFF